MKKFVSMFLALAMCLSLAAPAFAVENDPYLEEIKRSYVEDHCFYQITDGDYLDSLADDEIIETFHNINVTKKLLDENMILDINKVTKNDVVPEYSPQNAQVFDTETRHTLSSSYDNVVVIKKGVVQKGLQYEGTTAYLTYMYMSNQGIVDFVMGDWSGSLGKSLQQTVAEWAVCTAVGLASAGFGAFLSLAIGVLDNVNAGKESAFREALTDIYYDGGKAIVTMSTASRSCEKWTDSYFYTEDGSRGGLDITSEYSCYNNKKIG